jgi:hypothetical protein
VRTFIVVDVLVEHEQRLPAHLGQADQAGGLDPGIREPLPSLLGQRH